MKFRRCIANVQVMYCGDWWRSNFFMNLTVREVTDVSFDPAIFFLTVGSILFFFLVSNQPCIAETGMLPEISPSLQVDCKYYNSGQQPRVSINVFVVLFHFRMDDQRSSNNSCEGVMVTENLSDARGPREQS